MDSLENRPFRFLSALIFIALSGSVATQSFAQIFPIQANTQLQGPFTPYLSDYTAPGSQKLLVQLRVNDPTLAEYSCKLRVTIEGVGITLRTKQSFIPEPIVLSGGGIPEIFYGDDLATYFDPDNLDFAGFSRAEFNQSARLPEGVYRFTIEVLDYNKNIVVSNAGTSMAWIILNDPPILNLPRNETKLQLIEPTNIVFTWTPRHKGSPNAALSTEYIFRLVEIWPANRNPYDAFLTQPALYETTTDVQQLLYGPAEPALIPGRKYAWQVQAVDIENRDLFKNQGRSEVFVFQYDDELTPPENLRLQSANPTNLTVRWDQVTGGTAATSFRVQYRQHRNRSSDEWYVSETTDQWRAIPQLKSDTEYEVQVRAEQIFQQSGYTPVQIFKTLSVGENEFVCRDDAPPPPLPSSTTPMFNLAINDTIKAGGYNVLVRRVTGGSGTYSGEGMAIIPYLNGAKVRVTFENIRVNGQNMLTAGIIKSFWNPDSKFLLEVETPTLPGQQPSTGDIPVTIVATETLIEITGAAIATVSKDEDGNIIVHTTDGQQQKLEKGETYSVVDEQGNGYVIDDQGNIAKTSAAEARAAHDRGNRTYNLALTFAKGDGKLGFDDLPIRAPGQFSVLNSHYQQVEGKYIAWKAVTSSSQDVVNVIPENPDMDLNGVRFEVNGTQVQPQNNAGNISLNLYGKTGGMVEELVAITGDDEQSEVLGKLNLVSYDGIIKNVVIVPVNDAALPGSLDGIAISNRLTDIFQQAVTKVQVSMAPDLTVTLNDTFDDGESGMLSNYTGDMKKVINAFGNIQDDTYYLFLVEKPQSGQAALGFMPRSKQVGFIFADNLASDAHAIRTMAHELSHGMFNLKHTFAEFTALSRGTTENLMDYSASGTELLKYQWDYVHNPQRVVPLFEGDEEGESLCNWWYQNVTSVFFDNEQDNQLKEREPLFKHVFENFDVYFAASQTENRVIEGFMEWSARKSSFSKKQNLTLVERLVQKFLNEPTPSFVLHTKGIFLGQFAIDGSDYKIVLYSENENISLAKTQVEELCDLVDHEVTRIVIEEKYMLLSFFNEGQLQLTLQIFAKDDEDAKTWLTYLNLLNEGPSVLAQVKAFWNELWADNSEIEALLTSEVLTVSEINSVRQKIKEMADAEQKKKYYLDLQKKIPYYSQLQNVTEPYVTCNQTSLAMCLEGIGIANPETDISFPDYLEQYRDNNNLGNRTYLATRKKEIEDMGGAYEEVAAIDKNFTLFRTTLLPILERGDMVTFSMGNHIVRLVEIQEGGIVVNDPYGCLTCKDDLVKRQEKASNVYCSNGNGHASCCNATTAYVAPCGTNSIATSDNLPGKNCFWSSESVNSLYMYNILVVKPE